MNYENRINELMSRMTLEEKIGQLQQCGPSLVGSFDVDVEELMNMVFDGRMTKEELMALLASSKRDFHEDDLRAGRIGSYMGVTHAETALRLQKIAVEESRLGIPLLFACDVIHGFKTVTPIPLAESCAWDKVLWEKTARMAAEEATSAGIQMTFAPMVDVSKDARWGRIAESAGEDALVNGAYGTAKVRGFQTDDPSRPDALSACVKHFAAYGAAEAGRDYNRVDMSRLRLYEEYLPSYEACVKAGALAVMPAFNDINGEPCSSNRWLLTEVLRNQWGFHGMTVSDSNAVDELVNHGNVFDRADAAKQALEAGMDMDMASGCFIENLKVLAESGKLDVDALNRAVADVLRVKFTLGLFDDPYQTTTEREAAALMSGEKRTVAREAAQKSIVLLKNNGVLPLKAGTNLGIMGSLADNRDEMLGTWAVDANSQTCVSIVDACKAQGILYTYFKTAADACASDCDVILAAVGEKKTESGEAASKVSIDLSAEDMEILKTLHDAGKTVVTVLFNGRPLAISWLKENVPAIVEAWHPGTEAGSAILDILFGRVNPSAKLTTTFPASAGQCPMYYDHINTGRPGGKSKFTSKYIDAPIEPVYPFGYGLSYTTFTYSGLAAKQQEKGVAVSVTVANTGDRAGDEIVQCYFRDPVARRVRPVQKLADFARISLEAGEQKEVSFFLPYETFGYYDQSMSYVVDDGEIIIMVGGSSVDTIHTNLVLART